jgi:hypothetical protein
MANISNIKVLQGNNLSLSGSTVQVTGALSTNGNLTVNGTITANELNINVTTVTSSVLYTSGSTKFGDTPDDTMQVTGSVLVSGSVVLAAGFAVTGAFSGDGAGLTSLNGSQITSGVVGVGVGGTGQTTYSQGQLLIGNSSGSLTKNVLTPGPGVSITNGDGTIEISATGSGGTLTQVVGGNNIGTTSPSGPVVTVSLSSSLSDLTAVTGGNFLVTASLVATSSLAVSRVTVDAPYVVNDRDNVVLGNVTGSADLIVQLPLPTVLDGRTLTIKRVDEPLNAGALQISCSVNIDNSNVFNLYGPYQSVTLIADSGSNKWFVV